MRTGDVVLRSREKCPPLPAPSRLWQMGGLTQPLTNSNTVELPLWVGTRAECDYGRSGLASPSLLSLPVADGKAGPQVIRVRELALLFTGLITWESDPCTSPGQKNRADLVG